MQIGECAIAYIFPSANILFLGEQKTTEVCDLSCETPSSNFILNNYLLHSRPKSHWSRPGMTVRTTAAMNFCPWLAMQRRMTNAVKPRLLSNTIHQTTTRRLAANCAKRRMTWDGLRNLDRGISAKSTFRTMEEWINAFPRAPTKHVGNCLPMGRIQQRRTLLSIFEQPNQNQCTAVRMLLALLHQWIVDATRPIASLVTKKCSKRLLSHILTLGWLGLVARPLMANDLARNAVKSNTDLGKLANVTKMLCVCNTVD